MKSFQSILAVSILLFISKAVQAQPDTARINQRILFFTDSLVKADHYLNWSAYADLAPASVVKYYGGKEGFIGHVQVLRARTSSIMEENPPVSQVLQLSSKNEQWQCVVRQSSYFHKEDKQYHFTTYLIGQSIDDGRTWRLFDTSYTPVANLILIFPDIFGDLALEQPTIAVFK
jgi:hypothetical protein